MTKFNKIVYCRALEFFVSIFLPIVMLVLEAFAGIVKSCREAFSQNCDLTDAQVFELWLVGILRYIYIPLLTQGITSPEFSISFPIAVLANIGYEIHRKSLCAESNEIIDYICYLIAFVLSIISAIVAFYIIPLFASVIALPLIGNLLGIFFANFLIVIVSTTITSLLIKRDYTTLSNLTDNEMTEALKSLLLGRINDIVKDVSPETDIWNAYTY